LIGDLKIHRLDRGRLKLGKMMRLIRNLLRKILCLQLNLFMRLYYKIDVKWKNSVPQDRATQKCNPPRFLLLHGRQLGV